MGIVTRLFGDIKGIEWFPILSLLLFMSLFAVMVIHTLKMSKSRDKELGHMPLDDDDEQ